MQYFVRIFLYKIEESFGPNTEDKYWYFLYFWFQRDRSPSERLVGKYDPKNYINKVPSQDASGNELPQWKRLLIAKQFAEKSLVEDEEQARVRPTTYHTS